jgi:hypothetical protein
LYIARCFTQCYSIKHHICTVVLFLLYYFVKISEAFTQQVCFPILDNIIFVAKYIWNGNYILTTSTFPLGTLSLIILGRSTFIRQYDTYIVFCNMTIKIILCVPKRQIWHFRFQSYHAQPLLSSKYFCHVINWSISRDNYTFYSE